MEVALAFEHRLDHWHDLFSRLARERLTGLTFVKCGDAENLRRMRPAILIGHESKLVADYLSTLPPDLKWVHFMSAGIDRALGALKDKSVAFRITNNRGGHGPGMSEYVLAMILHFEKNISGWIEDQRQRRWQPAPMRLVRGGKALVAGTGTIGSAVGHTLRGLGVDVTGVSLAGRQREGFDRIGTQQDLQQLLTDRDYVIACLPLTGKTRGAFGAETFAAMKPGAIFINVSRGELVDEAALIAHIVSGHLAGAALDAFAEEPVGAASPLWQLPNVIMTPHVAGRWAGGHEHGVELFARNYEGYARDGSLETEVFVERGY